MFMRVVEWIFCRILPLLMRLGPSKRLARVLASTLSGGLKTKIPSTPGVPMISPNTWSMGRSSMLQFERV